MRTPIIATCYRILARKYYLSDISINRIVFNYSNQQCMIPDKYLTIVIHLNE